MTWDTDLGYPIPYDGTPEQRNRNLRSHHFNRGGSCYDCDCKAGSITSFWPCGTEPPRRLRDGTIIMSSSGDDLMDALAEAPEPEPGVFA